MNARAKAEIDRLVAERGGALTARDLLEFARDEDTALHTCFTWDDSEAGEKYRLLEAAKILRVQVTLITATEVETTQVRVRTFTNLMDGAGYRPTVAVLENEDLTAAMLEIAKRDLEVFRRKYTVLRKVAALGGLFTAIDTLLEA